MKVVLINCNGFKVLRHICGQMHMNAIISELAIKIIKHNINITM